MPSLDTATVTTVYEYYEDHAEYYGSSDFGSHRLVGNTATIVVLYAVVALFGFLANAVVLGTLMAIGGGLRHSATTVFVAGLALSDMVLCVFNAPIQVSYELY